MVLSFRLTHEASREATILFALADRKLEQMLLNDLYLPGALVLAHSLRDAGTDKKLAVLVTLDSVSASAISQLEVSELPLFR